MIVLFNSFIIQALINNAQKEVEIYFNNTSFSSSEILQRSINRAIQLKKFGLKPQAKVLLLLETNLEFAISFYALTMLDTIIVLMDPELGHDHFKTQLEHLCPDHILIDSKIYFIQEHPILRWLISLRKPSISNISSLHAYHILTIGVKLPIFHKHKHVYRNYLSKEQINWLNVDEDSDYMIIYTSGTTSDPKAVVHSYKSIKASLISLEKIICRDVLNKKLVTNLPHYLLLSLSIGLNVNIWKSNLQGKAKYDFIQQNNITTIFGPPSEFIELIEYVESNKGTMPTCLKHIYLGSAPVYNHFLSRLISISPQLSITCMYGMTENLVISTIDGRLKVAASTTGDLVGDIEDGVQIELDENGELKVFSEQLFKRYLMKDLQIGSHSSGDLALLNSYGQVELLGRKKDMIIRSNYNIYPSLYEATMNRIPGIIHAVMIGLYKEQKADEEIILVVSNKSNLTEAKIRSFLIKGEYSIDMFALPDHILFLDIPTIGRHSKVDKKELQNSILSSLID